MPRIYRSVTFLASVVVICFTLGFSTSAWSQGSDRPRLTPEQKQKVTERYEKALRLYHVGKYDEALAEFQAAYLISADPVMLYNIGQCHRLADRPEEAARFYRNYLRVAPEAPNRVAVEKQIAAMEKLAAEQAPAKAGTDPGATPTVPPAAAPPRPTTPPPAEGTAPPTEPPADAPPPFPTAPPPPFQTPQPPPVTPTEETGAGEPGVEVVDEARAEEESAHGPSRVVPLSLMIGGGALLVTSTVFGLAAAAKANDIEDRASQTNPVFDTGAEESERAGRTASALAVVTGLVGVAAGTTGIILWIRSAAAADEREEAFPPLATGVFPLVGPGLAGAGARVTF